MVAILVSHELVTVPLPDGFEVDAIVSRCEMSIPVDGITTGTVTYEFVGEPRLSCGSAFGFSELAAGYTYLAVCLQDGLHTLTESVVLSAMLRARLEECNANNNKA